MLKMTKTNKKVLEEREHWLKKLAEKNKELNESIKAALQIKEASDMVIYEIIKKYGTEGTIIIPKPKENHKVKCTATEHEYVLTIDKGEG